MVMVGGDAGSHLRHADIIGQQLHQIVVEPLAAVDTVVHTLGVAQPVALPVLLRSCKPPFEALFRHQIPPVHLFIRHWPAVHRVEGVVFGQQISVRHRADSGFGGLE